KRQPWESYSRARAVEKRPTTGLLPAYYGLLWSGGSTGQKPVVSLFTIRRNGSGRDFKQFGMPRSPPSPLTCLRISALVIGGLGASTIALRRKKGFGSSR